MNRPVSPISQRIALKLDVGMAFEALILNRLARLPNTRRQEWLRGLLVQGFQSECRALRKLQRDGQAGANAPPQKQNATAHRSLPMVTHQAPIPQQKTTPQAERAGTDTQKSGNRVSFAALRKVIG